VLRLRKRWHQWSTLHYLNRPFCSLGRTYSGGAARKCHCVIVEDPEAIRHIIIFKYRPRFWLVLDEVLDSSDQVKEDDIDAEDGFELDTERTEKVAIMKRAREEEKKDSRQQRARGEEDTPIRQQTEREEIVVPRTYENEEEEASRQRDMASESTLEFHDQNPKPDGVVKDGVTVKKEVSVKRDTGKEVQSRLSILFLMVMPTSYLHETLVTKSN
jgi:hypothetical protein